MMSSYVKELRIVSGAFTHLEMAFIHMLFQVPVSSLETLGAEMFPTSFRVIKVIYIHTYCLLPTLPVTGEVL